MTILKIDNFTADELKAMNIVFGSEGWGIIRDKWLKEYQRMLGQAVLSPDCTETVHQRMQGENILLDILIKQLPDHTKSLYEKTFKPAKKE